MPLIEPATWSEYLRQTLGRYDDALIRSVAGGLVKPRNQWPVEELIERCVATVDNAAVIDRRLRELQPAGRRLLALLGHSRQPRWKLGNLLELLAALGHAEGPQPVFELFEAGLLYPDLLLLPAAESAAKPPRLQRFETWLGQSSVTGFTVFAHPHVTARALGEDLGLPPLGGLQLDNASAHEADGLEWPLRLAVVWQQVSAASLRRTQQGDFFKRDLDRLRADPLLAGPPAENLADLPDPGLFAVALAEAEGLLQPGEGELQAGALPPAWEGGLPAAVASLWAALPLAEAWNPLDGWQPDPALCRPYASAQLLALLLLGRLPDGDWVRPASVEDWVLTHHPYWSNDGVRPSRLRSWVPAFLLGVAYQLRLVQATRAPDGDWVVRLSPLGRWALGIGESPPLPGLYAQTVLVQPNLEIVAYRQGLTPALIGQLGRFAAWKSLGSACLLQLQPDTVYRGLQSGLSFDAIWQTLERHGMRPTPPTVLDSLRTWADKRERITVYPTAALFEFATSEDLNEALARGLPAVRLGDRLALVSREGEVDFRHFRLTGTRDYGVAPEKCVEVDPDGVTLAIDVARSDLLLETELLRFAEPVDGAAVNGRRRYRLTPASLAAARENGVSLRTLEDWFGQRSGQPLSAAARLLLTGVHTPPASLRRPLVLQVATPEIADGLQQWPGTRGFIRDRLGPTTLVVDEEGVDEFRQRLEGLGVRVEM